MSIYIDFIIVAILLMNFIMLSSSRIRACIRTMAMQGILVGLIPFAMPHIIAPGVVITSFLSIVLKGAVFPWLLFRALQEANIRKEVEPVGGYPLSLLLGVVFFMVSYVLSSRLTYVKPLVSELVLPVAFATFLTGAFMIVSRMKALTQVIGYLIVENGIYLFGSALLSEQHLLVELAILLDIFVAVFVMGIAMFHINREFDHIDTQKLSELKDWIEPQED
ncbi:MAG: hydrogenase [Chlamydiota bacterium]|nr:hydrogenase [Chlamydiota bacterium]